MSTITNIRSVPRVMFGFDSSARLAKGFHLLAYEFSATDESWLYMITNFPPMYSTLFIVLLLENFKDFYISQNSNVQKNDMTNNIHKIFVWKEQNHTYTNIHLNITSVYSTEAEDMNGRVYWKCVFVVHCNVGWFM